MSAEEEKKAPEESTEAPPTTEAAAEAPTSTAAAAPSSQNEQGNPNRKRKVALFLAYVGHGYQGMQRNPGARTIEEDLFKAIATAGGISEANADERGFMKVHWMRAARTDKGVSAVGQVVSLNMVLNPPGILERINEALPSAIRALGFRRTVKGFDSRKACDKRRYEYILPVWMFDPAVKGMPTQRKQGGNGNNAAAAAAAAAAGGAGGAVVAAGDDADANAAMELAAEAADEAEQPQDPAGVEASAAAAAAASTVFEHGSTMVFDDACVQRMNDILGQYKGTHNFHNFTVKMPASSPQAKRYMLSFTCEGVFHIGDEPWVRLVVIGQSFMLHQIRKMVGMALAEFRGTASAGSLRHALSAPATVVVPMAPDLGLFLDECYYDAYNNKWGDKNECLRMSDFSAATAEFKGKQLYPKLAQRDRDEKVNAAWLWFLTDASYQFSKWRPGGKQQRQQQQQNKRAAVAQPGGGGGMQEVKRVRQEEVVEEQPATAAAVEAAQQLQPASEVAAKQGEAGKAEEQKEWSVRASLDADYSD